MVPRINAKRRARDKVGAFSRFLPAPATQNDAKMYYSPNSAQRQPGFTAIEVLLVVGLLSAFTAAAVPALRALMTQNDLENASATFAHALRQAQFLSQAVDGDTSWGVVFTAGSAVIFRGNSFATRDPAFDELETFSDALALTGLSEIVFTKFTGLPQQTGTITLTAPDNATRTITLTGKGTVEY